MRTMVSREARIIDEHRPFLDTIGIYQDALSFLIDVADGHYGGIRNPASQKAMTAVERMVHSTSSRKAIHPSFDIRFPKFPPYLRRAAIFEAIAAVMLYRRNLSDWESSDRKRKKPRLNRRRNAMPAFYRGNMFILNKKKTDTICAVDIGVSNAAVCSIIRSDGTVTGRKFISFPGGEDRLLGNHNENLARMTAAAIAGYASSEGASVIVMEHLNPGGKTKGSRKERLHLWRKRDILKRTEAIAHRKGIRFSTVYAGGTSKYAFDGSGAVARDKDNHSLCTFKTGKRYNADLSASYNIGGRYLIRGLLKACPETEASEAKAKVPGLSARATCTLSTYISLLAVTASA